MLCDRAGNAILSITRIAKDKQLVFMLDRPAQCSFTVPADDPLVHLLYTDDGLSKPYLATGCRTLKAYRKEAGAWVLRFNGIVWEKSAAEVDQDSSLVSIAVTCYDPWQILMKRLCCGTDGSFDDTISYSATDGATIAKQLVDNTNANYGSCGIETTGTFASTTPQDASYVQYFAGQALIDLCNTDTMDVILDPVDRTDGVMAEMSVVAERGAVQPDAIFGYDRPPHSVLGWQRDESLDEFANDITLYTGQTSTGKKEHSARRTDTGSQSAYGVYQDAQVLTDIWSQAFVDTLADTEILLRKQPRELIGFAPVPERCAPPWDVWFLGDTGYVYASENTGDVIEGESRIYGFTLDVNNDGPFEKISELIISAQGLP